MKYRLKRIIRRVLNEDAEGDDLAVDRSLDREIRMAPGRLRSPESKYGWQEPGARYGRANQDTFNIVRPGDEMHVFDFDDTLGEGFGPTLVIASMVVNGELLPITNFADVLKGFGINALTPKEAEGLEGFHKPNQKNTLGIVKGEYFREKIPGFLSAQVVTLDTAAFADFRAKFSKEKADQRLPVPAEFGSRKIKADMVIGPKGFTTRNGFMRAAEEMKGKPDGSMVIGYDFSPSLTLGDKIKRYKATNDLALASQDENEPIGVITARKGVSAFDSFSGNRPVALNAKDMKNFLTKGGLKWSPTTDDGGLKFVHGAADYSNDGGKQKAKLAKGQWLRRKQKHLRFYDDDKRNAKEMSALCDDPEVLAQKSGGSINVYSQPHGDFDEKIGEPVFSCMIEGKIINLSESQFRKMIRESLVRGIKNDIF